MKRFPEDDPEGLFPRRGRRRSRRRRQPLSALLPRSGDLQTSLLRELRAGQEFQQRRERALGLAQDDAPKVVLDTNVVSAGLTQVAADNHKEAGQLFKMAVKGLIVPVGLPHLIRELESLGPKRKRQGPGNWTENHRRLLGNYRNHVLPLGAADLSINLSDLDTKRMITGLVPDDPSDAQVLASSLIGLGGPLSVVTYDRHILDNAGRIWGELGIEAVRPETWLQSVAAGLLAGGKD